MFRLCQVDTRYYTATAGKGPAPPPGCDSRSSSNGSGSEIKVPLLHSDQSPQPNHVIKERKASQARASKMQLYGKDRIMWRRFALVWNQMIHSMRERDLLSNKEEFLLLFRFWGNVRAQCLLEESRDASSDEPGMSSDERFYFPIFMTAGCIDRALELCRSTLADYPFDSSEMVRKQEREGYVGRLLRGLRSEQLNVSTIIEVFELVIAVLSLVLGPSHWEDCKQLGILFDKYLEGNTIIDVIDLSNLSPVKMALADFMKTVSVVASDSAAAGTRVRSSRLRRTRSVGDALGQDRPRSMDLQSLDLQASLAVIGKDMGHSDYGDYDRVRRKSSEYKGNRSREGSGAYPLPMSSVPSRASSQISQDEHSTNYSVHPETMAEMDSPQIASLRDTLRSLLMAFSDVLTTTDAHRAELDGVLKEITTFQKGFFWDSQYAAACVANLRASLRAKEFATAALYLLTLSKADAEPAVDEARRRIKFFVNTMFMDMPQSPSVRQMCSFSTLTPYCNEDIIYTKKEMLDKSDYGVSILFYLRTMYPREWANFLERMQLTNIEDIWSTEQLTEEVQLWGSFRGQTLVRTVAGMMVNEQALRLLAEIDCDGIGSDAAPAGGATAYPLKYSYVVSCQNYGKQKQAHDPKAQQTEWLLERFPNLRVAYIDERNVLKDTKVVTEYYSVLIKYEGNKVKEVYRVKLPGNPMLGEGKPENQNHAMIFTRGEALQTIDMNQDGYVEESLKVRNLLQEFLNKSNETNHGRPYTIVGIREHIFTGSLSSLAKYMAMQEETFVSLSQRVLFKPLHIRMHYGHPDFFDKIFSITRGGVSKASKGVNLSEDIFAGYNHTLRGGRVSFHEYIQVGKGRDVGMQQIYKFEAKIASGNAEQVTSRDLYRIANRLDFFRLLSFYHANTGLYFNTVVTVWSAYVYAYIELAFRLNDWHDHQPNKGGGDVLNAAWVLQLGMLLALPMIASVALEKGIRRALWEFLSMFCSGSPLFNIFHMGT